MRLYGTIRQQIMTTIEEFERPPLQPLAPTRFRHFHEAWRIVKLDGHVEVTRAYCSVPPENLGRQVGVCWDGRLICIFGARIQSTAVHVHMAPGWLSTLPEHVAARQVSGGERGTVWLMQKITHVGSHSAR